VEDVRSHTSEVSHTFQECLPSWLVLFATADRLADSSFLGKTGTTCLATNNRSNRHCFQLSKSSKVLITAGLVGFILPQYQSRPSRDSYQ